MNMQPSSTSINVESFAGKKSVLAFRQLNHKAKTRLKISQPFGGHRYSGVARLNSSISWCLVYKTGFFRGGSESGLGVSEKKW